MLMPNECRVTVLFSSDLKLYTSLWYKRKSMVVFRMAVCGLPYKIRHQAFSIFGQFKLKQTATRENSMWIRTRLDLNWMHARWVKCVTVSSYWIAMCSCHSVLLFFFFFRSFFLSILHSLRLSETRLKHMPSTMNVVRHACVCVRVCAHERPCT